MQNSVYIRLHLEDGDIRSLLEILPIPPTRYWQKGDAIPNRKGLVTRKQSTWELKSPLEEDCDLFFHINNFISLIKDHMHAFESAPKNAVKEFVIVSKFESANIGFALELDQLLILSQAGFSIDVDFYSIDKP